MRKIVFLLIAFGWSIQMGYSQYRTEFKKERNLVSVMSYHDNGEIAQKGYLKNNKLHGEWVSFSNTGKKMAQGTYLEGKKTGKWFFWNADQMTEVTFVDNRVVEAAVWEKETIASVD